MNESNVETKAGTGSSAFVTYKEAAAILGVSPPIVARFVKSGRLERYSETKMLSRAQVERLRDGVES